MTKPQIVDLANEQIRSRTSSFVNRLGTLLGMSQNGKRNLYDVYGYDENLGGDDGFQRMYAYARRQGIANRLTFGVARTCWRDGFEVLSDPDNEESQQLVDELQILNKKGLINKLEQADILNRIGRFSVLLVGIPDGGKPLSEPLTAVPNADLSKVYFKAFAYDGVTINTLDTDKTSERFGLPEIYQVQRGAQRTDNQKDVSQNQALLVHWTRLVHLNENALDSEIEGMGTLEPIFNRILDLEKATGGSAEAYFRNARGKIAYEIDKDFAAGLLGDKTKKEAFDEGVQKFSNEWQDHTMAAGATVKTLPTPQESPLDTVKVSLWEISGYTGYPIRVLTGEGSGQLAGSEDQLAVNQITADRQRVVCSVWAMAVLEIFERAGMLKIDPSWSVVFRQQRAATEIQQADIDNKKADTLSKITAAKTSMGGDGLDIESALDELGLGNIKVDADALMALEDDDLDDEIDPQPTEG